MADCIFCKIGKGEIAAKVVYQDAELFAFEDISPQAPVHILVCTRKHLETLGNATQEDAALLGRALLVSAQLAAERGIADGFRTVVNNGRGAQQSVFHFHVHILGGREFRWPPG